VLVLLLAVVVVVLLLVLQGFAMTWWSWPGTGWCAAGWLQVGHSVDWQSCTASSTAPFVSERKGACWN